MKFKKTELKKYVGETAVRGIPNRPEKKSFFDIFSIHASYDRFPYSMADVIAIVIRTNLDQSQAPHNNNKNKVKFTYIN